MEKIIFFGTHNFAAAVLEQIINSGFFDIIKIISQPDKPVGRKQILQPTPVKLMAEKYNLPIEQPKKLNDYVLSGEADLNIVCQYGLMIPKNILETAKRGSINIHTSLLPKYRGASPIQSALINGDKTAGITIMLMDEKMDHGPILTQTEVPVDNFDTYPTLSAKMAKIAPNLLITAIKGWLAGEITPTPQNEAQASYCKLLTRSDGAVDWKKTAREIYNLYRGSYPWPGIWTTWQDKRLKLLEIKPANDLSGVPAGIYAREGKLFGVCADNSAVEIIQLQLEGRKPMSAAEFINGFKTLICHSDRPADEAGSGGIQ